VSSISLKVVGGQRIRIPKSFAQELKWLANQRDNVTAKVILGNIGGVQIAPSFEWLERFERLSGSDSNSQATMALKRYADSVLTITFQNEKDRFTLGMPKIFRDLGVLPSFSERKNIDPDSNVILWTNGSILEIWRTLAWLNHLKDVGLNSDEFFEAAERE